MANVRLWHRIPASSRFVHVLLRQRVVAWKATIVGRLHWVRLALSDGQALGICRLDLGRRRWSETCVLRTNRIRSLKSTAIHCTGESSSSDGISFSNWRLLLRSRRLIVELYVLLAVLEEVGSAYSVWHIELPRRIRRVLLLRVGHRGCAAAWSWWRTL